MLKKKWRLEIRDDLDMPTAGRIGAFIESFTDSTTDRRGRDGAYYYWKLIADPAKKGFVTLAMAGDRIVGTTTLTAKQIRLSGTTFLGGEIGDTYTAPDFQRQGIFSALVNATRERAVAAGFRLIYGTPNAQSLVAYEKNCEFRKVLDLGLNLYVLPIRPLAIGSTITKGVVSSICDIAKPLDGLSAGFASFLCGSKQLTRAYDWELDRDWLNSYEESQSSRFRFSVLHDDAAMRHRFVANPENQRYVAVRLSPNYGNGLAIMKRVIQNRLRTIFVAHLDGDSTPACKSLWRSVIRAAAKDGAAMVAIWAISDSPLVRAFGAMRPKNAGERPVIIYDHDLGAEVLRNKGVWRFGIMDSDNI